MLGSLAAADDALQEAWLRLARAAAADRAAIANLGGWLTTVVARLCLDQLRARRARPEDAATARLPDPLITADPGATPADLAATAEAVAGALLVVLEQLSPAERLAFVLHDLFATPFEAIAPIVGCSPAAARQHASRARRRIHGAAPAPATPRARQRELVTAFLAASRRGDFAALLALLDPDVVHRSDRGVLRVARGADLVSRTASAGARTAGDHALSDAHVLVNGSAGAIVFVAGAAYAVLGFAFAGDRIVAVDVLADPARLAGLDLARWAGA